METDRLVAVIMAGGRGERFWPLSRRARPKQLLNLDGSRSLIQQAVERVLPLTGPERVLVVTGREYADSIREQLPELPASSILVEPAGKNTAACIGLAAVHLSRVPGPWGPDPIMLVLPADHVVRDGEAFRRVVRAAAAAALRHPLVTLGIWPTRPETGYGYIELGERAAVAQGYDVYRVQRFVEKPDRVLARRYVTDGRHLWNSGMFVWRTGAIREAIATYMPALHEGLERIAAAWGGPDHARTAADVYARLDSVSIDYGVLERAREIAVIPADFGWDDAGSWPALERLFSPDEDGNVVQGGHHVGIDTSQCIVFVNGEPSRSTDPARTGRRPRLVATLGVRDLVIVETEDVTLVCAKDRAQDIKHLLAALRAGEQEAYL
ncbi:mannose-1-phosphate guanylyltransferase [Carboxydochorda subterranea]|uniref:Mannose-1-phosphate guanylyltransferase n=1 Tax=Carboxydichorda subterranea TaxID=3109565 RepID=A0ABZ1BXY0_9FIRM|nr:mannose-1-phosphate guanylyltransferase [Limnochorda sp. L945t]WRP17664.1 mannose-1-phosphate guanylyltransferase [Limnochorda sp. L945t]